MKALTYSQYGEIDVLQQTEIERPTAKAGEVLVQVKATSINVIDYRIRKGLLGPIVSRKFPKVPGTDVAGVVVAVGSGVTNVRVGDEVFGATHPLKGRAMAEYVVVRADAVTKKPAGWTFEQAASLPVTGLAALYSLRELGRVKSGDKVLINGSSGAAGLYAVQIAKQLGASVTAVSGPAGTEISKRMGADRVVDYSKENILDSQERFDVILEFSSKMPFKIGRRLLTAKGRFVEASPNIPKFLDSKLIGPFRSQKHLVLDTVARTKDLEYLAKLVDANQLQITIAKTFPFQNVKEAFAEMERGRVIGKLAVSLG